MQHIQTQLSQNQKMFSDFSSAFLKSALNLEYFQKKMSLRGYLFLKI